MKCFVCKGTRAYKIYNKYQVSCGICMRTGKIPLRYWIRLLLLKLTGKYNKQILGEDD